MVDPRTPIPRDIAAVSATHFAGARSMIAHLLRIALIPEAATHTPRRCAPTVRLEARRFAAAAASSTIIGSPSTHNDVICAGCTPTAIMHQPAQIGG